MTHEYCATCQHVTKPFYARCPKCEGDKNRAIVDETATLVRELKESVRYDLEPDRERAIVRRLHELGHPDVNGLLGWIAEQRKGPAPKQTRRRP